VRETLKISGQKTSFAQKALRENHEFWDKAVVSGKRMVRTCSLKQHSYKRRTGYVENVLI